MPYSSEKFADIYAGVAMDYFADCETRKRPLVYFCGEFYQYDGRRYDHIKNMTMDLGRWLLLKKQTQNNSVIREATGVLARLAYHNEKQYPAFPFYVGNDDYPDAIDAVAFNNGILDMRAWRRGQLALLPHTADWISPYCADYDFSPDATCDRWMAFLNEIFSGDAERIALLQEWFGYCLTADTRLHFAMWFYGLPRAGKGTVCNMLSEIVGKSFTTGFSLHSLANDFGLRWLEGKLVAFIGEVHLMSKDKARILGELNSIIGEDPKQIEKKGLNDAYSVILPTRFTMCCNELPQFLDPTGAQAARALLIRFDKSFVGKEDRNLLAKLLKEREGIALWALQGYRRLRETDRFSTPQITEKLRNEFRRESSISFAFMQDCLVVSKEFDKGTLDGIAFTDDDVRTTTRELQTAYCQWCDENGLDKNYDWLMRDLRAMLSGLDGRRVKHKNNFGVIEWQREYDGIGLLKA